MRRGAGCSSRGAAGASVIMLTVMSMPFEGANSKALSCRQAEGGSRWVGRWAVCVAEDGTQIRHTSCKEQWK